MLRRYEYETAGYNKGGGNSIIIIMAATNPWNVSSDLVAGFKLGDPDSVLVLAKQHGLYGGDHSKEVSSDKSLFIYLLKNLLYSLLQ